VAATRRYWRGWLGRARLPDHRWRDPIQRSALAIKGLTYIPTGATVAALTTSLPETPGGERNWDYRYTWLRDSTFTLQALHYLNLDWEADEFMQCDADLESAWGATADEIKADILEHGVREGILRQHYDTDALDASTLLAALFGFLPGDDERLRKSVEAIADQLTENGFVLRYRTDETDDG